MNENRFDLEQIQNAYPLSSFLHQLRQQPKRCSGGEHFYHSMTNWVFGTSNTITLKEIL